MILLLMAPLFFVTPSAAFIPTTLQNVSPAFTEYIKAFGIGLVAVSFTYGGYQQTINFGADVENPRKNIPRGIFIGIFIIITLYLAINYAYINVIGFENLKGAKNIAAIMASHVFGDAAGRILSVLLFLSVLAYVNVLLMSNPRVMYAMSEDNVLPKMFGAKNERTNVLTTSLSVFAAICILIVFWAKEFDEILSFTIFLDCIGMATSAATIFILRKRTKDLDESKIYTIGLYPLLPLIFISAYIFVAISIFIDRPATALTALAVLAGFTILYFITKGTKGKTKTV
jgi:APA family basic amino acid/polyamine antiporter